MMAVAVRAGMPVLMALTGMPMVVIVSHMTIILLLRSRA